MLDRGEKIELLVDKTDHLQGDAFRFKKQTTRLKQQMWMKSVQMTVLIVCAGLLALYFLIGMICGFSLAYCRPATQQQPAGAGTTLGRRLAAAR